MDYIAQFLEDSQISLLFLVIGLGYLLGQVKIKGFEFGTVAGVLVVGLIFGQFDYEISPVLQTLGFTLFIASVGYQAGPKFFNVLFTQGIKYLFLAVVVATTGFFVALGMSKFFGFEPGTSAGLLAGGMTSTPTLAAAQAAVQAGQVPIPEGFTADEVVGNITTGYAITYIFGLVGLILLVRFLPKVFGVDLVSNAKELERQSESEAGDTGTSQPIVTRAYTVRQSDVIGIPLSELDRQLPGKATVVKLKRGDEFIPLEQDTMFEWGDSVSVVGYLSQLVQGWDKIGPEISDEDLLDTDIQSGKIVISKLKPKGYTLGDLAIVNQTGCILTKIQRLGTSIPIQNNVTLLNGDVLWLTGPSANLELLSKRLGYLERQIDETDLVTLGIGIAVGGLVGTLAVSVGGLSLGLGSAGGLLTVGLIVGYLRSIHPTFGRAPAAVIWLFMELGLLVFMTGVGLKAGQTLIETLLKVGPTLFFSGVVVTFFPVVVGFLFGRYVLKLPPAMLMGGITGSMTSGASLKIVTAEAQSSIPALGYTGAYAFANVLLTIAGSLIIRF